MSTSETGTDKLETVITYLEMHEPPRAINLTPPGQVAFMKAHEPTLSFYRYLYNTVGEPWMWYERRSLDDDALAKIIHDSDVDVFVLYVGGVPAGYAELDRRKSPDIELAYLGLIPEFVGRALGPCLLHWALDEAWNHQPTRVWVHTCTLDHPKALPTYQRAGFTPYRQETKVFDDPRQSGVMPTA